jgi:hypothetical protein
MEKDQETQETPEGLTIPVPSREAIEDGLAKLTAPKKPLPGRGRNDDGAQGEDSPVKE